MEAMRGSKGIPIGRTTSFFMSTFTAIMEPVSALLIKQDGPAWWRNCSSSAANDARTTAGRNPPPGRGESNYGGSVRFKRFILLGLFFVGAPLRADVQSYDALLRRYVNDEGLVDYEGIREGAREELQAYLAHLAGADLKGWSYEQKLVFWINVYNAHMIQNIVSHPEMKKVSENFGLFDVPQVVAGGSYSLNDIESRILRGKVNDKNKKGPIPGVTLEKFDPRIHFALVCAAVDCPKLQNFAYTSDNLERTLQSAAVRFASSPKHVAVVKGRLCLSSLLKWYWSDFDSVGGVPVYLIRLLRLTRRPDAGEIERLLQTQFEGADYQYEWPVNDIRNAKR